jgi:replicative DNA helicase
VSKTDPPDLYPRAYAAEVIQKDIEVLQKGVAKHDPPTRKFKVKSKMNEKDEIIQEIQRQEPTFLRKAKKAANGRATWVCPQCGNGSGKEGDGIALDTNSSQDHPHYKCFRCDGYFDVIDLWQKQTGADFRTAVEELKDYYGISGELIDEHRQHDKTPLPPAPSRDNSQKNLIDYFRKCRSRIDQTDYATRRGLSQDVINKFWLGYDPEYQTNAGKWAALIIPTGANSCVARNTDINATGDMRIRKKGKSEIFNLKALDDASRPVFICEGEIDALSIITAGGSAVGLGSVSNAEQFIKRVEQLDPKELPPLIVALDNDDAGRTAAEGLKNELNALNIMCCDINIYGEHKDANEALTANKEAFIKTIQHYKSKDDLINKIKEDQKREYIEKNSTRSYIQDFMDGIADRANTPATPTGFKLLDETLGGGLREGLHIIGAVSSLGKTTFILQVADQIAQQGQDVLIFSLEMARTELMAKSISRLTLLNVMDPPSTKCNWHVSDAKTELGITSGDRWGKYTDEEVALITKSIEDYDQYAGHIFIKEGVGDLGTAQVRQAIKQHINLIGRKPVVFVDYLQILAPYNERYTDKQNTDKSVLELKRISRDFKIPVIGVSSLNRANYNTSISMAAFKESGAIEYSSDVLIGLQFKGIDKDGFSENEAKKANPREIELVFLKHRKGPVGRKIEYEYYPLFNFYKELKEV